MRIKLLSLLVSILFSVPLFAGNVTLTFDPSTTPNVEYFLHWGTVSGEYTDKVDIGTVTLHTITGLQDGTYYFVASAFDANGNRSVYSNECMIVLQTIDPPGGLTRVPDGGEVAIIYKVPEGKDPVVFLTWKDKAAPLPQQSH